MAVSRQALDIAIILLIYASRFLSAVQLRGLESPLESGSDVTVTCEGGSADVEFLSSISIYGKLPGQAEKPLVNVFGTLTGVKKDWSTEVEASFRERASFTASMTVERAFIGLQIRNLSCSDSGMMFRCKIFGVGVSATSKPTQLRVQASFSRLYIDGGEFDCDSVTSQSLRMPVGCEGCDRVATRGKMTSFSCWGDVDANLRDNFTISWYRTTWDNASQQWANLPIEGVRAALVAKGTIQVRGQNDSDCQMSTLKNTIEHRLKLDEQDMEFTCEITGPSEQGVRILANNTIKTCSVDPEDVPMDVVVTPPSIVADIGNSTVFLCKANVDLPVTYEWFKMNGSKKVAVGGRKSDSGFLRIGGVTEEETGTYICLAKDMYRSKEVHVQLQYPDQEKTIFEKISWNDCNGASNSSEQPEIIIPEEVVVVPGVPMNLVCSVRASGRVDRLVWPVKVKVAEYSSRRAVTLPMATEVLLQGRNATATSRIGTGRVDIQASGNYSCHAMVHGVAYSKSTYISVEGDVSPPYYAPRSAIRAFLGSSTSMSCTQKGNPKPVVTWLFKKQLLHPGPNAMITTSSNWPDTVESKLQLFNLTYAMIGNYTCRAENRYSVALANFTILRKGPPAPPILGVCKSEYGQIQLNVTANPDDGGDSLSSYIVTYQLFPQGKTHKLSFSAEIDVPTVTVTMSEGSLRLAGGKSRTSGRVEIFHNGVWGTICKEEFDRSDAQVVCRQLGFRTSNAQSVGAYFGPGSGPIHLEGLRCRGTEAKLTQCRSPGWGRHYDGWRFKRDCNHGDDVGVSCHTGYIVNRPHRPQERKPAEKKDREVITFDKIVIGHAHYVAVSGQNGYGPGDPAEILLDI